MKRLDKARVKLGIIILCSVMLIIYIIFQVSKVRHSLQVEAGTQVTADDFIRNSSYTGGFQGDYTYFDTSEPGDYKIKINVWRKDSNSKHGLSYSVKLHIEDTVAPVIECEKLVKKYADSDIAPEAFVTKVEDKSKVELSFIDNIDVDSRKLQKIKILAVDEGKNENIGYSQLIIYPVRKTITISAGEELPKAADYFVNSEDIEDNCTLLYNKGLPRVADVEDYVGVHTAKIINGDKTYNVQLEIVDIAPPEVCVFTRYHINQFATVTTEELTKSMKDYQTVSAEFNKTPDTSVPGSHMISITYTDAGGNSVTKDVELVVAADTEAPQIVNVKDAYVCCGDNVSYKKMVVVEDNSGTECTLDVDNSKVDLDTIGDYPVKFVATDMAGNKTEAEITLHVVQKKYEDASLDKVKELADEVLDEIITDDMTDYEKAYAIYRWVKSHIAYAGTTTYMDGYVQSAYIGLTTRRGNCYEFRSVSEALLTQAGIPNMEIDKETKSATNHHFWNLVDVGDGWVHFDTTSFKNNGAEIFCWTDAQLSAFSTSLGNTHVYNRDNYPEIN